MKYRNTSIIGLIVGGLAIAYFSTLWSWIQHWYWPWLVVAMVALLVALVRIFVFTYQMWSAIQDGHARMTPRQAVLYNFIPIFNLYWLYQCIWGFSHDANAYIKRHKLNISQLSTTVFFWYVTLWLLSPIPYLGIVTVPLALILVTILLRQTIYFLNHKDR